MTTVTNCWPLREAPPDVAVKLTLLHAAMIKISAACERHGVMLAADLDICIRLVPAEGLIMTEICEERDGSLRVAMHARVVAVVAAKVERKDGNGI